MLEDLVLDAGEEGLGEYLIDDDVLPRLRGIVLPGEGLYTALAEEARGKIRGGIGGAALEVCRADFLALCWPGILDDRLGAFPRHHLSFSSLLRRGRGRGRARRVVLEGKQGSFACFSQ